MKCSFGISSFLEEISSFSRSVVFLYFFALIAEEGFLISPCYSLELCIIWVYLSFSPLPFTSLLSSAICKASSDNHLAFLVLITTSCTMCWFSPGHRQHLLDVCYLLGCWNNGNSDRLYFLGFQNHCGWWLQPWNKKAHDKPRQHIK